MRTAKSIEARAEACPEPAVTVDAASIGPEKANATQNRAAPRADDAFLWR